MKMPLVILQIWLFEFEPVYTHHNLTEINYDPSEVDDDFLSDVNRVSSMINYFSLYFQVCFIRLWRKFCRVF